MHDPQLLTKQNNFQPNPTITLIRSVTCHTYDIKITFVVCIHISGFSQVNLSVSHVESITSRVNGVRNMPN